MSYTRADILRLAGFGPDAATERPRPWAFLPLGVRALAQMPGDATMRFLVALNFARLALAEPAREHLAALAPQAATDPNVQELATLLRTLRPSRLDPDHLRRTCAGNLTALAMRGIDLRAHLPAWTERLAHVESYRALDGNVARFDRTHAPASPTSPTSPTGAWLVLTDAKGEAAHIDLSHLAHQAGGPATPPVTVEGADPAWTFQRIMEVTARPAHDQQVRVTLVQRDPMELLDGLSTSPLSAHLADPRLHVIVGEDAATTFEADLLARLDTHCIGPVVFAPGLRRATDPGLAASLIRVRDAREREHIRLAERVREAYAGRDASFWRRRFAEATSAGPGTPPLRVLIPTSRYTTYLRHSASDLGEAIRARGFEARVLIEDAPTDSLSSIAYLRAIDDFAPDLVLMINYTRRIFADCLPPELPTATWVQDAMPHLFERATGAAQGPLDVLLGHLDGAMFRRDTDDDAGEHHAGAGFDPARARNLPVLISGAKFHDAPVDPALAERLTCEAMFVSHHSETPEAMHARKLDEASKTPGLPDLLDTLRPRVHAALEPDAGADAVAPFARLLRITREALTEHSTHPEGPTREDVFKLHSAYTMPLADRLFRHRSLEWARAICARRGWRLHLYGRGWDRHPTLAPHARGELPHDETLRAAYRCARASLSLTIHTPVHQRVMECALAGGLPIARFHGALAEECFGATQHALATHATPVATSLHGRHQGYRIVDSPEAMATIALHQRLGLEFPFPWAREAGREDTRAFWWISDAVLERRRAEALRHDNAFNPARLLVDPAEVTFRDEASLERLLERAVEHDAWREHMTRAIGERVREGFTLDTLIDSVSSLMINAPTTSTPEEAAP